MADPAFTMTVHDAAERIRADNGRVNAFVSTRLDAAIAQAAVRAAEPVRSGLHGVPYGLKDEWETLDLPTTGGSYRHRDRRSSKNSAVFDAFHDAGAILVGKTNLSDLGLAPEATNYIVGPSRNPWDRDRTAGGSSGGAAAAVAAGMQAFDWGTDIGGSIRQPAAFCGLLGMRLSSETWPLQDSFPFVPEVISWMCGQGPLTRKTAEMRAVLDAAAPRLRTGTERAFRPRTAMLYAPSRLGRWPTFEADVTPHLESAFDAAVRTDHGLPTAKRVRSFYSAVWASNLENLTQADDSLSLWRGLTAAASSVFFGERRGDLRLHPDCAQLLLLMALGRVTIFRNRARAMKNADLVRDQFGALWDKGCVVVSPVSTGPAPLLGKGNSDHAHVLLCTASGNLADATALAIPFGRFDEMPRAIQLMGPPGSENILLDIADRVIESRDREPELRPRPFPGAQRRRS